MQWVLRLVTALAKKPINFSSPDQKDNNQSDSSNTTKSIDPSTKKEEKKPFNPFLPPDKVIYSIGQDRFWMQSFHQIDSI